MKRVAILLLTIVILSAIPIVRGDDQHIHMDVYTDKNSYLSNEVINITYSVYGDNGRIVQGVGRWTLKFWNYTSLNYTVVAQGNFTKPQGSIEINLNNYNMSNAGTGRTYWINISYYTSLSHVSKTISVNVMNINYYHFYIYLTSLSGVFSPGCYAKITLSSPIPSLTIDYLRVFYSGGTIISLSNLRFDYDGLYTEPFKIPSYISPGEKIYVTASVGGKIENVNLTVQRDYGVYFLSEKNMDEQFLSGGYINLTVKSEKTIDSPYYHFIVKSGNGKFLAEFIQDSQNFSYHIPENFQGILIIICHIFNSTQKIATLQVGVPVVYAHLRVYFDREYYKEGDSFTAYLDFTSIVISNPQFVYNIYANFGYGYRLVKSINTINRSLKIRVSDPVPNSYKIVVYAIENQFMVKSSSVIEYKNVVTMNAYVMTRSDYASGVYIPGQTIEIKYKISGNIKDAILRYGIDEQFYSNPKIDFIGNAKTGTITIKIPENAKTGIHVIHMEISYQNGKIDKNLYIQVDENPPWSLYLVWGMPVIDFIVLIIIIVATISLYMYSYIRYRDKISSEEE